MALLVLRYWFELDMNLTIQVGISKSKLFILQSSLDRRTGSTKS